jgi:hypothetical protein
MPKLGHDKSLPCHFQCISIILLLEATQSEASHYEVLSTIFSCSLLGINVLTFFLFFGLRFVLKLINYGW